MSDRRTSARGAGRPVLGVGLCAAVFFALLAALGALDPLERASIDWRYAHARLGAEPLSDRVALVAIDDVSLAERGKWSQWTRSELAMVIDELSRSGAGVIALDLILDAPSSEAHDAALAAAIARAGNVVLGVDSAPGVLSVEPWTTREGRGKAGLLVVSLHGGLGRSAEEIADAVSLQEPYRGAFLERSSAIILAYAKRAMAGDAYSDKDSFARGMAGVDERIGSFKYEGLLHRAWRHRVAAGLLFGETSSDSLWDDVLDKLPLPVFASGARGAGFVSVTDDIDPDRAVRLMRHMRILSRRPVGALGVAALGTHTVARRYEPVLIDWPTTRGGWIGAFGEDRVISILMVIELAEVREKVAAQREELDALAGEIAFAIGEDELTDEVRSAVRDEVAFQLEGLEGIDRGTLSAEERDVIALYEQYDMLARNIASAEGEIGAGEERLRGALEGKTVFLGWAATGSTDSDVIRTPLAPNTPGVVAHCTVASMLLEGNRRTLVDGWVGVVGALVFGGVCAWIVAVSGSAVMGAVWSLGVLGVYALVGGVLVFSEMRVVLPMAGPIVGGGGAWAAATAAAAFISQRDRARVTRQFKARVDPALVDRLVDDPDSVSVSGVTREATIIFLDLAGFTTVAETLDSQRTVAVLNRFMREMTHALTQNGAYVNKFLGDGLMAFFSAFQEDEMQTLKACAAAVQCRDALETLNMHPDLADMPALSARIGIATGKVTIGDCGSPPELNDYTAIGDSVNLSARLESAAKQFGVWSLIDAATRDKAVELGFDGGRLDELGRAIVVGRSEPTTLYTIPGAHETRDMRAQRRGAVEAFVRGDLDAARGLFESIAGEDRYPKLAALYLANINLPEPPTDGVLRLTLK